MTPLLFLCWLTLPLHTATPPEELPAAREERSPAEATAEELPEGALPPPAPSPPVSFPPVSLPSVAPSPPPAPLASLAPAFAPPAQENAVRFHLSMGKGFSVSNADDTFSLRLRAMAQLRNTTALEGKTGNEFSARGVRLLLEGRALEKRLGFVVHVGLSPDEADGGSGLLDAWVSWKFGRDATLRIGQHMVPYDMTAMLGREGHLGIVRENATSEFGIQRDVGLHLSSEDFLGLNALLGYHLGVYGGQGRNRLDLKRTGFLYVARLVVRPFGYFDEATEGDLEQEARPRLSMGFSMAHARNITRVAGHSGALFDSFAFPPMHALYFNADSMLKWRGLHVSAQYSRRVTSRAFVENDTERVWGRSGHGYALRAGAMLTGKLEAVGRFSQLFGIGETDPALLALPKNEFGIGLNCYFIGHALKAQAEYSARFSQAKALYQHWLRLQLQVVF